MIETARPRPAAVPGRPCPGTCRHYNQILLAAGAADLLATTEDSSLAETTTARPGDAALPSKGRLQFGGFARGRGEAGTDPDIENVRCPTAEMCQALAS
jgi:hypothetical protein